MAGLLLILIGIERGHVGGVVLTLVGIVPLLAGVTNVCLIAPVVRAPFSGRKLDQQR